MPTGPLTQLLLMMMTLWLPARPTGRPAPAATVLRHVPADARIVATLDAGSLTRAALDGFRDLGTRPFVKGVPSAATAHAQLSQQLNASLRMVTAVTGIDPARDLRYLTLSVVGGREPRWVLAVGGNLRAGAVERLAGASKAGSGQPLAGGTLHAAGKAGDPSLGWTRDGVLLVGELALVRRLLGGPPRPGALARMIQPLHDAGTLAGVAVLADRELEAQLRRDLQGPLRSLGENLSALYLGVRYDGARIALRARQAAAVPRYRALLDGLGSYMAAAELMLRGSLRVGDGVLVSGDKGLPPELAALARHKQSLLQYIDSRLPPARASHRVSEQRGPRQVRLDYSGSRVTGLLPLAILGGAALGR